MTDAELKQALSEATERAKNHTPWIGIITIAVMLLGGLIPWINGIGSRLSVVEAKQLTDDSRLNDIDKVLEELAALRQELTDVRTDLHDNGYQRRLPAQLR